MKRFEINKHIALVAGIMQFMGIWPKESSSVTYKIKGLTTILFATILSITTLKEALKFANIESTSFSLCCFVALFHTAIKSLFLVTKGLQISELLGILKKPVLSLHEEYLDSFLVKKMQMCRRFQLMLLFNAITAGVLIILSPFFETDTERPVPIPFPIDMRTVPFSVYILVWCFQIVTILITTFTIACFDGLILTFMATGSALLKILREQITHATDSASNNLLIGLEARQQCDFLVNRLLKQCVIKHLWIAQYIALIEDTFSYAFLIQLVISLLVTCFIVFSLVLAPINSIYFGRCLFFFLASSMELIFFCVPGNEIILQSIKIRDACYMSDWASCGPSVRKTLLIIMERTKRPFNLNAVSFAELSLDTLLKVFKSAFSYFTVLQQMYDNTSTR